MLRSVAINGKFQITGLRWWIAGLLFAATLISYLDRLTLSILAPKICADLNLSNLQYASISVWFLLAYSFGQTIFGKIQDRVGSRLGLTIAMTVWSVAEILQAFTTGLFSLCIFRSILGLGEGGHWPAAIKSIAEWFPREERAFGMGIVNTGATLGSALAPPLVVWLQLSYGWRTTFVATGFLGFAWLLLWIWVYQPPTKHRWIAATELAHIQKDNFQNTTTTATIPWLSLLRNRKVLGIVLSRSLGDPVWRFYLVWLPLYLSQARGLKLKQIGLMAWVPFLAGDAGALLGGWFSGFLIRRGMQPLTSRRVAVIIGAALTVPGVLIYGAGSNVEAISLISIVLFGFQFWVTMCRPYQAIYSQTIKLHPSPASQEPVQALEP
jgi:ACS family hexuronate transporter-like MFS transporter